MSDLTAAIRSHLTAKDFGDTEQALLAVLDKCEQLSSVLVGPDNEPVGRDIAAEFEQTIARALGITT